MQLFGERALVPTPSAVDHSASTVRVTSYNVLADCNAGSLTYDEREDKLLRETVSTKPHIIALQDVEMYDEFWRPRLNKAGFDTVFKQRTSVVSLCMQSISFCASKLTVQRVLYIQGSDHREGVLIGWRRDQFQLCRRYAITNTLQH
jgi:mRNA deadenylase 3'-5' endonuclease subunit Ccr4